MELHVEALFVHDDNRRMVRVNVAEQIEAPRFFLGRTPAGIIVRFGVDLPDEVAEQLTELSRTETLDLSIKDPVHRAEYISILETHSSIKGVFHEQAFVFPGDVTQSAQPHVVRVTDENADLLRGGFEDWLPDIRTAQPFVAFVQDDRAVSLCASVRITHDAHECGIETLADQRGRGYAAQTAIGWAAEVRKLGVTPLYSTMWSNISSQRVASKIGCVRFGSDFYIA